METREYHVMVESWQHYVSGPPIRRDDYSVAQFATRDEAENWAEEYGNECWVKGVDVENSIFEMVS